MAGPPLVDPGKPAIKGAGQPDASTSIPPHFDGDAGASSPPQPNLEHLPTGWDSNGVFRSGFPVDKNIRPLQFERLIFTRTQQILQKPGETSGQLHERLREQATKSMSAIRKLTQVITPSWLTVDASKMLGIKDAVLVSTSTCVHELPSRIFVGILKAGWVQQLSDNGYQYTLYDLGRKLTSAEKNALYDAMRV